MNRNSWSARGWWHRRRSKLLEKEPEEFLFNIAEHSAVEETAIDSTAASVSDE